MKIKITEKTPKPKEEIFGCACCENKLQFTKNKPPIPEFAERASPKPDVWDELEMGYVKGKDEIALEELLNDSWKIIRSDPMQEYIIYILEK